MENAKKVGGSAWESNPPGTVLAPHTGFEVREPHQRAVHFRINSALPGCRPGWRLQVGLFKSDVFFCQQIKQPCCRWNQGKMQVSRRTALYPVAVFFVFTVCQLLTGESFLITINI